VWDFVKTYQWITKPQKIFFIAPTLFSI